MRKGTAVRKIYQNQKIDTSQPIVPEQVSVALDELTGELREIRRGDRDRAGRADGRGPV